MKMFILRLVVATTLFCTGTGYYLHCTEYCVPWNGIEYCTTTDTPEVPPLT